MQQISLYSSDPCTGEVIWTGSSGDVDASVARARGAAASWAATDIEQRVSLSRAFQRIVLSRRDQFATLISKETGKPLWEAQTEVTSVAAKIDFSIAAQAERAGTRTSGDSTLSQVVRHKPHGVLVVLGPYNFPAHLPNGHIAPALLAGNVIVFKPSELTPATGAFLVECWHDAGLPDGVLTINHGDAAVGRELAEHPEIDGLLFTGSSRAAAELSRQFADTPHRLLAVEAGGNNPLVVWDVPAARLEDAAAMIIQSAYLTAGQRCTCARRLIVSADQAPRLLDAIATMIDHLIVDTPFVTPAPFMGSLIDQRAADRVLDAQETFVSQGAIAIRSCISALPGRPLLSPGLLDVTGVKDRPDEEIFGPLLQVVRVGSFEDAIREANATRFGLAAGLIGGDQALYDRFWQEVRAGVVNWNRPTTGAASNAPFGGVGASGNHRPSAAYAADYCAWPVASLETAELDFHLAQGLRSGTARA